MTDKDVNTYFSNYVGYTQTIPNILQTHVSSLLHSDSAQNHFLKDAEEAAESITTDAKCGGALTKALLQLNEAYDARLSEFNEVLHYSTLISLSIGCVTFFYYLS